MILHFTPVQRLLIQKMTPGQRVLLERLRKNSHVVKAAQEKPPQLRTADKSSRSCGTCSFFSLKGRCNMYGGYPVKASQLCSEYVRGTPGTKTGVTAGGPGSGPHSGYTIKHSKYVDEDNQTRHVLTVHEPTGKKVGAMELIDKGDHTKVDQANVDADRRGIGLGKMLYQKAMEVARSSNSPELRSAYSVSHDAARVWRSLGAREWKETPQSNPRFAIRLSDREDMG